MVKGLFTAYTGMINEQHRMDVLTNNLANASTVGYKKEGTTSQAFDEVLALKIKDTTDPGKVKSLGNISLGVKIGENYTDYSQGSLFNVKLPSLVYLVEVCPALFLNSTEKNPSPANAIS